MRPSSGRTKPAIKSSVRVLPDPLGPNNTATPEAASNSTSSENAAESSRCGNVFLRRAASMDLPRRQTIRQGENQQRHGGDYQHQRASQRAVARFDGVVDGHGHGL